MKQYQKERFTGSEMVMKMFLFYSSFFLTSFFFLLLFKIYPHNFLLPTLYCKDNFYQLLKLQRREERETKESYMTGNNR